MTLDELRASLPKAFSPWVGQYGPVFLAWTAADLKGWIELLVAGDVEAAYGRVLEGLPDAEARLAAGRELVANWENANVANRERVALQRTAWWSMMRILLTISLAAVGL